MPVGPIPARRWRSTSASPGSTSPAVPCKVKYLVATLPFSNAYFAKAYPIERLESLLDGIESAFRYFGGIVDRVVLDNTSLAVKDVLAGRDPCADRGVRCVPGRVSVPGGVLRAGKGLGEVSGFILRTFPYMRYKLRVLPPVA